MWFFFIFQLPTSCTILYFDNYFTIHYSLLLIYPFRFFYFCHYNIFSMNFYLNHSVWFSRNVENLQICHKHNVNAYIYSGDSGLFHIFCMLFTAIFNIQLIEHYFVLILPQNIYKVNELMHMLRIIIVKWRLSSLIKFKHNQSVNAQKLQTYCLCTQLHLFLISYFVNLNSFVHTRFVLWTLLL